MGTRNCWWCPRSDISWQLLGLHGNHGVSVHTITGLGGSYGVYIAKFWTSFRTSLQYALRTQSKWLPHMVTATRWSHGDTLTWSLPVRATLWDFREMEWIVGISWQSRDVRGTYGVYTWLFRGVRGNRPVSATYTQNCHVDHVITT